MHGHYRGVPLRARGSNVTNNAKLFVKINLVLCEMIASYMPIFLIVNNNVLSPL